MSKLLGVGRCLRPIVLVALFCAAIFAEADNDTAYSSGNGDTACLLASGSNSSPLRIVAQPYITGRLRSPNFGQGRFYPPNSLCRWTIAAPTGHAIFLNISSVHIDATPPPAGSRNRGAAALGQPAVSNLPPGAINSITAGLASDIGARHQMGSHFSSGRSSMMLPAVDVGISNGDVASGCEGDYLEILDGADFRQRHQLIGRYCSDTAPRPVVSVYNEVQIVFQSDGFKEDTGFELEYTAVKPNDVTIGRDGKLHVQSIEKQTSQGENNNDENGELVSARSSYELLDFPMSGPSSDNVMLRPSSNLFLFGGDASKRAKSGSRLAMREDSCSRGATILTQSQGKFSSPNFGRGHYPAGSHCEWLVIAPRDRVVLLHFDDLRLEYGLETRGCTFDYVEVFDGRDPTAPVLGRFCGRASPKVPIRSTSNYLFVVFQTDLSREDFGFTASYQIVSASPGCDGTVLELNGKSGEVSSPNFGYGNYPSNAECRWLIRVPETFFVSLSFVDFDIESHGQQPAFGNGGLGTISQTGQRRCSYDFLEIFDGPNADDSRSYGRYCGSAVGTMPTAIRATQNTLSLVFRTDFSGERRGFRLQYTAVLPYPGCEGQAQMLTERSGEITSPSFGQDAYPPNSDCAWIVDPSLDHASLITVSFMHFQVEGRYATSNGQVTCPYDFVEVGLAAPHEGYDIIPPFENESGKDGTNNGQEIVSSSIAPNGRRRLCGHSLPAPFTLRGRRLRVRFHSDFNKQNAGFWLRYEIHDPVPIQNPTEPEWWNAASKKHQHKKKILEHGLFNVIRNAMSHTLEYTAEPVVTAIDTTEAPTEATTLKASTTLERTWEQETSEPSATELETTVSVGVTAGQPEPTTHSETVQGLTSLVSNDVTAAELVDTIDVDNNDTLNLHNTSTEMAVENGEFMLVVDEDLTPKQQQQSNESVATVATSPLESNDNDTEAETEEPSMMPSETTSETTSTTVAATTEIITDSTITETMTPTSSPTETSSTAAVVSTADGSSSFSIGTTIGTPTVTSYGGIVVDESFVSGDDRDEDDDDDDINEEDETAVDGEDGEEATDPLLSVTSSPHDSVNLRAVLQDVMPTKPALSELLAPLLSEDPSSLTQPSVNVTLLSLLDVGTLLGGNNNQQPEATSLPPTDNSLASEMKQSNPPNEEVAAKAS